MGESPPDKSNELENLTWELCGVPERRMDLLLKLYPKLPNPSFLKARVAYTLVCSVFLLLYCINHACSHRLGLLMI